MSRARESLWALHELVRQGGSGEALEYQRLIAETRCVALRRHRPKGTLQVRICNAPNHSEVHPVVTSACGANTST